MIKTNQLLAVAALVALTGCTVTVPSITAPSARPTATATESATPTGYSDAELAYLAARDYDTSVGIATYLSNAIKDGYDDCATVRKLAGSEVKAVAELTDDLDYLTDFYTPAIQHLCPEFLPLLEKTSAAVKAEKARKKRLAGTILTATANGSAVVTYSVDGDGVEQRRFSGTWTKKLGYDADSVIVGVNAIGASKVTCKVTLDGDLQVRHTSTGRFSAVTCTDS